MNKEQKCIAAHLKKPWIPGFEGTLICPLRRVKREWLGEKSGTHYAPERCSEEFGGWVKPTSEFWKVHCRASHSRNCDVNVHTRFLTDTGKDAEFLYGALHNGQFTILEKKDFEKECASIDN